MDARAKRVAEILNTGDQYRVPFFQRAYSWQRKDWVRLWDDLTDLLESDVRSEHFLGSLVCTPLPHVPGEVNGYQLIDGQQRLTTLSVMLCAIADVLAEGGRADAAGETREDFLIHRRKKGDERYKVLPRPGDKEFLAALIDGSVPTESKDGRIAEAYRFLRKRIASGVAQEGLDFAERLRAVVTHGLQIVVITIDQEDPYEIFESLNSTGLPLSEADLVRNYVFMKVPVEEQEAFDGTSWAPIEGFFDGHPRGQARALEDFYRAYLASFGGYIKRGRTYATFKDRFEERQLDPGRLADELRRFLSYEELLADTDTGADPALRRVLADFVAMEARTAVPLVFALLEGERAGHWATEKTVGSLRDLVSFLLRRALCRESTRPYGRWFAVAVDELMEHGPEGLRDYFLSRGWPDDVALVRELVSFPIYKREFIKARHLLLRLEERLGHKERVDPSTLTVEHVMPQKIASGTNGQAWKEMLGEDWKEVHAELLHTLGNLTLTGYNPELSNRAFGEKRGHLRTSNLLLNQHFADRDSWDAGSIQDRSEALGVEISGLWPRPEGLSYRPGLKLGRRLNKQQREKLRLEFWSGVLEGLRPHSELWESCKPNKSRPLRLETGYPTFRWYLYLLPLRGILGVSVLLRGAKALEYFDVLRSNADEIEEALVRALDWESSNDGKSQRFITAERGGVDFSDRESWPELQDWCCDQVLALEEAFEPHFQELQPTPDADQGFDRAYWESRASGVSLQLWDELVKRLDQEDDADVRSRYGSKHLSILRDGKKDTSVRGWPRRGHLLVEGRMGDDSEAISALNAKGLNARPVGRRRVRLDIRHDAEEEARRVAATVLGRTLRG